VTAPGERQVAAQRLLQQLLLDVVADQLDVIGDQEVRRLLRHLAERLRLLADDGTIGGGA
jgi:uncharacterized protein YicC (UPF0701 family)